MSIEGETKNSTWLDSDFSDDEEDYDYDELTKNFATRDHCAQSQTKIASFQPSDKLFKKFTNKINVEKYAGPQLPHNAGNKLAEAGRRQDANSHRSKDKQDRATAELVMDPRTRMILFKLLNRGMIQEINGCISTGNANTFKNYSIDTFSIFRQRS